MRLAPLRLMEAGPLTERGHRRPARDLVAPIQAMRRLELLARDVGGHVEKDRVDGPHERAGYREARSDRTGEHIVRAYSKDWGSEPARPRTEAWMTSVEVREMFELDDGGSAGEDGWSSGEGDPIGLGAAAAAEGEEGWSSDEGDPMGLGAAAAAELEDGWSSDEGDPMGLGAAAAAGAEGGWSSEGSTSEGDAGLEPGQGNVW